MTVFSDLNLNVTHLSTNEISDLVKKALKLGYDCLGLSIDFEFPTQTKEQEETNKQKKNKGKQVELPKRLNYSLPLELQTQLERQSRKIKILERINIKINDSDINTYLFHLKSKEIQEFDLVSLEPLSKNVLSYLCTQNYNADILSINHGLLVGLTDKHLMRPLRNATDSLNLSIELNYSQALSDSYYRRDFIQLGRALTFNVKPKNLILSSNTSKEIQLKSPFELLKIVELFGINEEKCHYLVKYAPFELVSKAFCRKHTSSGIVYFESNDDVNKIRHSLMVEREIDSENLKKIKT